MAAPSSDAVALRNHTQAERCTCFCGGEPDLHVVHADRESSARLEAHIHVQHHPRLLIERPLGNLSVGMRQLNGLHTRRFNRRHQRVGQRFEGRFKAIDAA